jgi:starch synthase
MEQFWTWVSESLETPCHGFVVHLSMEHSPFSKGGGLGDMVGALPQALRREGFANIVISPFVPNIAEPLPKEFGSSFNFRGFVVSIEIRATVRDGVCCVFVEMDDVYSFRTMYADELGAYDSEVDLRYFAFGRAMQEILQGANHHFWLMTHDWHVGAIYLHRRALENCRGTVHVIHNYHYQGEIFPDIIPLLDPDVRPVVSESFSPTGRSSLSKIALACADAVVTVSRCYAEELRTGRAPHPNAEAAVARQDLRGITNGIDSRVWNPAGNPHLAVGYDRDNLEGKEVCKQALADELGLGRRRDRPLVLYMSRLAAQKGVDVFVDLRGGRRFDPVTRLKELLEIGLVLVVVGTPQGGINGPVDQQFRQLAGACPDGFRYINAYSDPLAHRALAGADVLLHPSRFEPCGLTQMYALAYGTVPVVTPVGGLKETVVCTQKNPVDGYGFHLAQYGYEPLRRTLQDVVSRYRDRNGWRDIVRRAMAQQNDWRLRAAEYKSLLLDVASGGDTL